MLGRDDITCLGGEPDKFRVLWSNVTSLWHHKGYLYVNDYKTGFVANDDACKLLELLEEHFDKMKRSEGNLLLAYLGYDRSSQQAIKTLTKRMCSSLLNNILRLTRYLRYHTVAGLSARHAVNINTNRHSGSVIQDTLKSC